MKDLISQFKSSIFKFYQNKEKEEIDPIILLDCNLSRFLIARDLDIDKALIMFKNVNTWRKNIQINDINISEIKKIKKLFPSYWLTLDKYGHPVYIECPGIINMKKLKIAAMGVEHRHIFGQITGMLDVGCEFVGWWTENDNKISNDLKHQRQFL